MESGKGCREVSGFAFISIVIFISTLGNMNQIGSGKGLQSIGMFWYLLLLAINYFCDHQWNGCYQITVSPITGKTIDFVKRTNKQTKNNPKMWVVVIYEYDYNQCTHTCHLVMTGIFALGSFYSCLLICQKIVLHVIHLYQDTWTCLKFFSKPQQIQVESILL